MQEFVVTDGISDDCILGWDSIRSHGFTVDGENQSIYLAREASGLVASPEISIVSKQRVKVPRQSILVIEANERIVSLCSIDSYFCFPQADTTQRVRNF